MRALFLPPNYMKKLFIACDIDALIEEKVNHILNRIIISSTMRNSVKLKSYSKVLSKVFKTKCNALLSSKVNSDKQFHFNALCYGTTILKRLSNADDGLESTDLLELKEAYESCSAFPQEG